MARNTGWMRNLIRRFFEELFGESLNPTPRQQIEGMLQGLSTKADVAAMARIRAEELREQLTAKVQEHDELGREAERYLAEGNESFARRSVERQLELMEQIELLTGRLTSAQTEADAEESNFRDLQRQVEARRVDLPEVERDLRYVQAREKLERLDHGERIEEQIADYDRARGDVRTRERQGRVRSELERGEHFETDRAMSAERRSRLVDEALDALRKKGDDAIDVEFTDTTHDPLNAARQLISTTRSSVPVLVQARDAVTKE